MTREEAIKIIKACKEKGFKYTFYTVNEYDTAMDMAIKALRREDTFLNKVLEIIDQAQYKTITLADGSYVLHTDRSVLRDAVLALKGGEQE